MKHLKIKWVILKYETKGWEIIKRIGTIWNMGKNLKTACVIKHHFNQTKMEKYKELYKLPVCIKRIK